MTIKELKTKKLTVRERLICQYAKEIMLMTCEDARDAIKDGNSHRLADAIQNLENEARNVIDNEGQLKGCLWLSQMITG